MKEAIVAPAPGKTPMIVPKTDERIIVYFTFQVSGNVGNFPETFSITWLPNSPSSRAVKTTLKANKPISAGMRLNPS